MLQLEAWGLELGGFLVLTGIADGDLGDWGSAKRVRLRNSPFSYGSLNDLISWELRDMVADFLCNCLWSPTMYRYPLWCISRPDRASNRTIQVIACGS